MKNYFRKYGFQFVVGISGAGLHGGVGRVLPEGVRDHDTAGLFCGLPLSGIDEGMTQPLPGSAIVVPGENDQRTGALQHPGGSGFRAGQVGLPLETPAT